MLVRPALDVGLPRAAHAQRVGGHGLGDDRTGRHERAVADFGRGHHHGVGPHEHVVADDGLVLTHAVIVAGDGAGADVHARAHRGVADVGEVRHLGARADRGLLDLDVGAGL